MEQTLTSGQPPCYLEHIFSNESFTVTMLNINVYKISGAYQKHYVNTPKQVFLLETAILRPPK